MTAARNRCHHQNSSPQQHHCRRHKISPKKPKGKKRHLKRPQNQEHTIDKGDPVVKSQSRYDAQQGNVVQSEKKNQNVAQTAKQNPKPQHKMHAVPSKLSTTNSTLVKTKTQPIRQGADVPRSQKSKSSAQIYRRKTKVDTIHNQTLRKAKKKTKILVLKFKIGSSSKCCHHQNSCCQIGSGKKLPPPKFFLMSNWQQRKAATTKIPDAKHSVNKAKFKYFAVHKIRAPSPASPNQSRYDVHKHKVQVINMLSLAIHTGRN